MTYSNRGNNGFGGGNYGKRDFGDRGPRPAMFDAVCAKCGTSCQVPFRPNGRKEVFCSKCFETNGGGSRESSFGGSNYSDKQMFSATCDQCGNRCEVPFRPTNGKPVLCSNCFAAKNGGSFGVKDNSRDLEAINAKLDKILKLLSPKEEAKEMTSKIIEEIELSSGKKVGTRKKKAE